jgi:hypothetical protein
MQRLVYLFILLLWFASALSGQTTASALSILQTEFQSPPQKYGIRCWWWWLNGNVTKAAISRDLAEMKAKGFSGACIFDAGGADQRANAQVPEGPMFGSPAWRDLYLHAINEAEKHGLVMSLSIQSGWNLGGPDITPAEAAKQVVFSETKIQGGTRVQQALVQPPSRYEYYQDIAVLAIPYQENSGKQPIRDFANKAATKEVGWSVPETRPLLTDIPGTPGEEDAALGQVLNISANFQQGQLDWNAPPGEWTVLRIGYSPTDAHVSTSSGKWEGSVIDYMSAKAFNRYWDTHVEPLLSMIGDRAGKTLQYLQTDSFEAGGMNWTDGFEAEFKKRRGYDPLPYLPILAGKIIENRETSNRFLNDLRKTLSDCISDNHYRVFAERARKYGIGIQPESAGPHAGPFDGLKNYGHSEIMMSEFWSPSPHRSKPVDRFFVKQAASAAKIFDKKLVGAESFTTIGPHWNDVIWADMKPSVDHEYCAGLNLVYLHTFTCSPRDMGQPGQEYFAGTHFNPNVTWWHYSIPFIQYLSRCQMLLQQGRSVADVLYYYGDHIPNLGRYKEDDPAGALPDYDYDLINEDKLLTLAVKDGQVVLLNGVRYRVLVLPNHQVLSLAALKKVQVLVNAGATVIGMPTLSTASLVGGAIAEQERAKIALALWGNAPGVVGMRKLGKGQIIWGKTAREVLALKVLPDCSFVQKPEGKTYDYIHRQTATEDFYFISSQNPVATQVEVAFRMQGKQPELWDAVTGEIREASTFYQKEGKTYVSLDFAPNGSIFVVFRKPLRDGSKAAAKKAPNFLTYRTIETLKSPWRVLFDPEYGYQEMKLDSLVSWHTRPEEGIKYFSGTAVYRTYFDAKDLTGNQFLDLGVVKDVGIAMVKFNGKDLGILWCPPYRVPIAGLLKPTGNELEVAVVNSWRNRLVGDRGKPQNQRVTKTNITIKPEWELLESGLLGPVRLLKGE